MAERWENPLEKTVGNKPLSLEGMKLFASSEWEKMVIEALENNPTLQEQAFLVEQAQQRFLIQKATLFPSITGNASTQHQETNQNTENTYTDLKQYNLGFQADWEIDYLKKNRLNSQK